MIYWNSVNAEYYFPFDVGTCLQALIKVLSLILAFYHRSNPIGFGFFICSQKALNYLLSFKSAYDVLSKIRSYSCASILLHTSVAISHFLFAFT